MKNKNKYENNLEKVFMILSYVIFFLGIALSIYSLISGIFEKPDDLLFGPIPKIMKFFASFVYLFYAFAFAKLSIVSNTSKYTLSISSSLKNSHVGFQ